MNEQKRREYMAQYMAQYWKSPRGKRVRRRSYMKNRDKYLAKARERYWEKKKVQLSQE